MRSTTTTTARRRVEKHAERIEILEAILLAVVAVATAWSGYQTARWDGRQAHFYGLANKERAAQNRAATLSGQQRLYDTSTFGFWLQEICDRPPPVGGALRTALPAGAGSLRRLDQDQSAAQPGHAPAGPIFMPQYHNAAAEKADAYDKQASADFEAGTKAREDGDHYLRNTVLLATVLFRDRALAEVPGDPRPPRADRGVRVPAGGRALLRDHVSGGLMMGDA